MTAEIGWFVSGRGRSIVYAVRRCGWWVASIVNAVGQSAFWNSTVIFVLWDDRGGWYDHAPPPQLDDDGLGFRVSLLCVSPYAKQGYVSHVQLESASVLRFVEDTFGLGHWPRPTRAPPTPAPIV
jgi:phospholipase C